MAILISKILYFYHQLRNYRFGGLFFFLSFLLLCLLCFTGCRAEKIKRNEEKSGGIKAVGGILDLHSVPIKGGKKISTAGQWEFFKNEHIIVFDNREGELINVPGKWVKKKTGEGTSMGPFGYGTYRLVILLDPAGKEKLSLYIPFISLSYRLFINGEEKVLVGRPGKNKEDSVAKRSNQIILLPEEQERIELVIHMSNYWSTSGGIKKSVLLGTASTISTYYMRTLILDFFLIGLCFLVGFSSLMKLIYGHNSLTHLSFGLFSTVLTFRTLAIKGHLHHILGSLYSFRLDFTLEIICYIAGVFLFSLFMYSLFKKKFNKLVPWLTGAAGIVCFFFFMMLEIPLFLTYVLPFYNMVLFAAIVYTIYIAVRAYRRGEEHSFMILTGFLLFSAAIINDILHALHIIDTAYIASAGFPLFVFFHFIMLSNSFNKTFNQVQRLSKSLEIQVKERTRKLRRANQRLLKIDEEKTQFIATVSHELRTPLTLIKSPVEDIMEGKCGDVLTPENSIFRLIHNNSVRLLNLIQNLLDFSRMELDKKQIHREYINAAEFLRFYFAQVESRAGSLGLKTGLENQGSGRELIKVDINLFETAIYNLFSNAMKFTEEGSILVKSRTDSQSGLLSISVTDTGIGFDEDKKELIFNKFIQEQGSGAKRYEGTGIGLALVKDFVELHDGTITVESTPGKGSNFTISLPFYEEGPEKEVISVSHIKKRYNYVPVKSYDKEEEKSPEELPVLLVVEDNKELRDYMVENLKQDFFIITALNGQEGLEKVIEYEKVDIIVSDIMTPVMDGREFFRKLKEDEKYSTIPFIFCTARANEQEKLESLDEGAIDYIFKPFSIQELSAKIKRLLDYKDHIIKILDKTSFERNLSRFLEFCKEKQLTAREIEVVKLLLHGKSRKEIAAELDIAINTSKRHIENIYRKLEICDRYELFALMTP